MSRASIKDIVITDPPPKGSDWATWVRWVLTLVTVIVSAYATWSATKVEAEKVKDEVKLHATK